VELSGIEPLTSTLPEKAAGGKKKLKYIYINKLPAISVQDIASNRQQMHGAASKFAHYAHTNHSLMLGGKWRNHSPIE
jgi:hypothetical protein